MLSNCNFDLTTRDIELLSTYLLTFCMSSLEKCLFRSFAHFFGGGLVNRGILILLFWHLYNNNIFYNLNFYFKKLTYISHPCLSYISYAGHLSGWCHHLPSMEIWTPTLTLHPPIQSPCPALSTFWRNGPGPLFYTEVYLIYNMFQVYNIIIQYLYVLWNDHYISLVNIRHHVQL